MERGVALAPELIRRVEAIATAGGRRILGIAGKPGAGKSTVAAGLLQHLGAEAVIVPMDGFHLSNDVLLRLGRREFKGAPDTFDAAGYVSLLRRLRGLEPGVTVYAPIYRRGLSMSEAGAIPIPTDVQLVITEGNYLLLDDARWGPVRSLLDEAWYIEAPEVARVARLIARHMESGKSQAEARRWTLVSDQANAELVATTRNRADLVVQLPCLC